MRRPAARSPSHEAADWILKSAKRLMNAQNVFDGRAPALARQQETDLVKRNFSTERKFYEQPRIKQLFRDAQWYQGEKRLLTQERPDHAG